MAQGADSGLTIAPGRALRDALGNAFVAALGDVDAGRAVQSALADARSQRTLVRLTGTARIPRGTRALAIGKAAPAMMAGALASADGRIRDALVIAPDGVDTSALDALVARECVTTLRASHPLPDARSIDAADAALAFVRGANSPLVLVLLSGGASALVSAPRGLSLAEKRLLTQTLLRSGASIDELNTVRRHLSRIKGGALTRAAAPQPVFALLVSDVIGDAPWVIGSGPTVPDPTSCDDARRLLFRFAPAFAHLPLHRTLAPRDAASRRQSARVVVSPTTLASAVCERLRACGLSARLLPPCTADVNDAAVETLHLVHDLRPGEAIVRAAEPTVVVSHPSPGRGGRSSHVAALVGRGLPVDVAFLAGASDGVDGASGAGGAVIDGTLAALPPFARAADALAAFDTGPLLHAVGAALELAPTGRNLADVHVLARAHSATR